MYVYSMLHENIFLSMHNLKFRRKFMKKNIYIHLNFFTINFSQLMKITYIYLKMYKNTHIRARVHSPGCAVDYLTRVNDHRSRVLNVHRFMLSILFSPSLLKNKNGHTALGSCVVRASPC